MFTVATDPQFTHTVEVFVPIDTGHERQTFTATYRVVPADSEFDLSTIAGTTEFLTRAVVSLGDLVGEDRKELPYSEGLRDRLFKVPYIRGALARTYFAAINKSAAGN